MEAIPAAVEIGHEWCRVAVRSQNGRTEVILDRSNERATPAVVARKDGEWIIGPTAIDLGARYPDVVLSDPVRLFGPEAIKGKMGRPADLYAAAVVLYEMVTGRQKEPSRRVFRSEDLREMLSGGMPG